MAEVAQELDTEVRGYDQKHQHREITIGETQVKINYSTNRAINPPSYEESLSLKFNDDVDPLDIMRVKGTKARISFESFENPQSSRIKKMDPGTREYILQQILPQARSMLKEALDL